MRRFLAILLVMSLTACGFQLRGSYSMPWDTLAISGVPENNELYFQIKRGIEATSQTRVITDAKEAQASLAILGNTQVKSILSLSGTGLVREYQLTRTFIYKIQDAGGNELVPANQIILQRAMTFDDAHLFAKEAEEGMIWKEMQDDLVLQLLRRLAAIKQKSKI
jgi:LPS-assembly lipoprotein